MPCYKPLQAFRQHPTTPFGKGKLSFTGRDRAEGGAWIDLACGQCIGCRLERSRRWAVRLMHEAQLHEKNSFITLTYDDAHVPSNGSLQVEDFQLFMKRLRKRSSGPIRFFHCGEYGETTGRPHYHACIFGEDFSDDRQLYKTSPRGDRLYNSAHLSHVWGLGHAVIGDLTFESAAYVARYVLKKITGDKADEHYQGRKPEYVTMSRRPGIGARWYERFAGDVYPADNCIMRGRAMMPPPFYDKLLEKTDPALFERIKRKRNESARENAESEDSRSRRLLDREACHKQTVNQALKRKL